MSFIYPWFLLALSAIMIPIIIHLFHFRRFKKIYFSNINFLERVHDETKKQAKLKHILVLLSRILAIIFLVMAFARPFIPIKDADTRPEGNKLSIFIDNSFSMEAGSAYGSLLDQAKQGAADIAAMFDPTDQYQLLTNDFEARHQRFVSRDEFLRMLADVTYSPSVREIPEVMLRQAELLKQDPGNEQKLAFILSDFQKNIARLQEAEPDTLIDYFMIPFQAQRPANVFIDSVWIENPVRLADQVISIEVRIFNDSDQRLENQPVRLYVNGSQRSVATYNVGANAAETVSLPFTLDDVSLQQGYVEITDHPVTFDDRYFFSFALSENIPVMAINQTSANRFINALLGNDETFILQNVNAGAIDFSQFGSQNLIIVNELPVISSGLALELRRYVDEGGNMLIFPPGNADLPSYNELLASLQAPALMQLDTQSTRVTSINELHSIYSGVFDRMPENIDLPVVEQYFVIEQRTRGREQYLMQLQNGNHFFTEIPSGRGRVYLSAVPANDSFSNFQRHAMFVPTIYNIALHSAAFYPLSYTIGQDEFVMVRNYQPEAGSLFKISGSNLEVIPEARNINNNIHLMLHGQIREHGTYDLNAGETLLRNLSFNYDRRESLLEAYSPNEIEQIIAGYEHGNTFLFEHGNVSFEKQMEVMRGGRQLWRLFLLIGLAFLLAEVFLLRFLK